MKRNDMGETRKTKVGLTESEDYVCLEDLQKTQDYSVVNPINLDYFGSEMCQPGQSFGPYVRENYVLHMVRSGSGTLEKEKQSWNILEGEAFLIYPGETTIYRADRDNPWNYVWVGFHGFRSREILMHAGFSRECPVVKVRDKDRLNMVLKKLLSELDLTFSGEMARTASLYELMALLAENHELETKLTGERENNPDYKYVKRAVEMIARAYRSHLRVEDIAKEIGISRNYLSSIFKREMGISPQEFLIDFRLEAAASLLRNTRDPVNAVAIEVGYSDPLSFSKAFRRKFGMSPTEFRETKPEIVSCSAKGEYVSDFSL